MVANCIWQCYQWMIEMVTRDCGQSEGVHAHSSKEGFHWKVSPLRIWACAEVGVKPGDPAGWNAAWPPTAPHVWSDLIKPWKGSEAEEWEVDQSELWEMLLWSQEYWTKKWEQSAFSVWKLLFLLSGCDFVKISLGSHWSPLTDALISQLGLSSSPAGSMKGHSLP